MNNCILKNLKLLITSDYKINEIKFKFNDLSSRLKTFTYLEINQPNDEMLLTILTKLLIEKQFIINTKDIFEYILRRVDRSYQAIHDIVEKLDVLSLEKKRQLKNIKFHLKNNITFLIYPLKGAILSKEAPKTNDTIADNLIKIFNEGPEVSFKGSPTVSPTTAA